MLPGSSHFDTEVSKVATVKELTASRYQITMTETELALVKNALGEAERVSRFGMEVLDDVDNNPGAEQPENSRLRREIDALAMREASLRSLQKTMAEVDRGGTPAPMHDAELGQLTSRAALQVPPSRL
jgi:hypothetical protein